MRKTALILALVAIIATGCSDNEEQVTPTTGDPANPPTTNPETPQARADALLIQNVDLPGDWSPTRRFQARLTEEVDLGDEFARCVGAGGPETRETEAERSFQQGVNITQFVAHEIAVSRDDERSRDDYEALNGPRTNECIDSTVGALVTQLLPQGTPAPTSTIGSIPGFTAGTDEFGYRVTTSVAGLTVTTDLVGMHRGRVNSLLQFTGTQGEPAIDARDSAITKTRERLASAGQD